MIGQITITQAEYASLMDIVNSAGVLWLVVNEQKDPTQSLIRTREHLMEWMQKHSMEIKTIWSETDVEPLNRVSQN